MAASSLTYLFFLKVHEDEVKLLGVTIDYELKFNSQGTYKYL